MFLKGKFHFLSAKKNLRTFEKKLLMSLKLKVELFCCAKKLFKDLTLLRLRKKRTFYQNDINIGRRTIYYTLLKNMHY